MSVTFEAADLDDEGLPTLEPCLCTQMDEKFSQWFQYGPGPAEEMRAAADPRCSTCRGSGLEGFVRSTIPQVNFSNLNAGALLRALDIKQPYYAGEISVAQARRGVMRALSRKNLQSFSPADWQQVFGGPRIIAVPGQDVRGQVERFSKFVESVAELGAKKIRWY